jgi:hypothetical protein
MVSTVDPRDRAGSRGGADSNGSLTDGEQRPTFSDRLPRPWLFPLLAFAGSWVLALVAWQVSNAIWPHPVVSWTYYLLFKDANIYQSIALHGYHTPGQVLAPHQLPPQLGFFPLFPMVIAAISLIPGLGGSHGIDWAGLIALILSGGASSIGVWALAKRVRDQWTADRAVLLYCAFPGAMTFSMLYSEPLAIALAAFCLLAALNRKWVVAGILGLLATAEHSTMVALGVALGLAALQAIWQRREWRALAAPLLTPLGILAYFTWLWWQYHDFFAWFWVEKRYWRQHIDWGRHVLHIVTWTDPRTAKYHVINLLMIISFYAVVVGIGLMLASRMPLLLTSYTVFTLIFFSISSMSGPKPRFAWTAFGIFIGAAARLPRWLFWPVLVASAALLGYVIAWWPHHVFGPSP